MNFYPVIVIYNESCVNSASFRSLRTLGMSPIIVDNSTKDMGNTSFCAAEGLTYHSMGGNQGLPKAYNAALNLLKGKEGFVIWLDDDTELTKEYFDALEKTVSAHPQEKIIVPVFATIRHPDFMISPCVQWKERKQFQLRPVISMEEIDSEEILSAINSAMAVNLDVYRDYRYDEKMFLDFVDHDFCHACRERGIGIYVMKEIRLYQDYSDDGAPSFQSAMQRCNIFSKDFRTYGRKIGLNPLVIEKKLLNHRLEAMLPPLRKFRRKVMAGEKTE